MTKVLPWVAKFLSEVALLKRPVTAAAVVAVIVSVLPGVHIDSAVVAGVLVGIGTVASFVDSLVVKFMA